MVLTLAVPRDFGADNATGIGLCFRAAHPADAGAIQALDFERAGARAIMWADAEDGVERHGR
jgi:hypothetical protein